MTSVNRSADIDLRDALAASELNFRTFFDSIDDLLFVLDIDGNIIKVNRTVIDRLGYPEDELLGRHVLMVHPEARREEAGAIVGAMLAGTEQFCPVPLLCRDGSLIPVETRVVRGVWNGEQALFGLSKDISALKQSEEKFARAFNANPALMALSTVEEGIYLDVNETFVQTLGFSRDEVIGRSSRDLNVFADYAARDEVRALLARDGRVKDFQIGVRTKSGEILDGLFSVEPIRIGERNLILTVMLDITARVRTERQLHDAKEAAEAADRLKSAFLATMSHELRTPLNSIIGFTGILRQGLSGPVNHEQARQLDVIASSAGHLLKLIRDVLDISKIEAGQLDLDVGPVALGDLIAKTARSVQPQADAKGLDLDVAVDDDVDVARTDERRVEQILLNLLSNAVKFTERGRVTVRCGRTDGRYRIEVADTGIGIAPESLALLFQPFRQIESELNRRYEGSGLGLSICKRLAGLMGGDIGVDSTPGQGSTFWYTVPVGEAAALPASGAPDTDEDVLRHRLRDRSVTVLLAEDNEFNREVATILLQDAGASVDAAPNGHAALEKLATGSYDVVLMDMQMPVLDGIATTRAIRANPALAGLPIIAMTANAMDADREACLKAGMDAHLAKPIEPGRLWAAILDVLDPR
jgi:PAS domain S-box-containing protein